MKTENPVLISSVKTTLAITKNLFINCAEFDAGVYSLVFTTDQKQYSKKLCVKK